MGLQRANWRKKKLRRSKMTAILQAMKSGMLSHMPRTALPIGLSRACSTAAELHKVPRRQNVKKALLDFWNRPCELNTAH